MKVKTQRLKVKAGWLPVTCHPSPVTRHLSFVTRHLSLVILFSTLFCTSCRRYNTQQSGEDTAAIEELKKEVLLRVNRQLVEEDAKIIEAYAKRKGWQMQTTGSGLWYMIYKHGSGVKAATGQTVTLGYTVSPLDSTICYSSEKTGFKVFRLGHGDAEGSVEPGLEEGVLLLQVGDKARLIMPPHLAYGLAGDGKCIPPRSIIIYDVELLSLK